MPKLTSPLELLKSAFGIYFQKRNFFYLVKVMLFGLLVIGLATLPAIILWLLSNAAGSSLGQNASFVLAAAGVIYGAAWMGSSYLTAVTGVADTKVLGVKETFREGRAILWRVMGASVISSLAIGVGYL